MEAHLNFQRNGSKESPTFRLTILKIQTPLIGLENMETSSGTLYATIDFTLQSDQNFGGQTMEGHRGHWHMTSGERKSSLSKFRQAARTPSM